MTPSVEDSRRLAEEFGFDDTDELHRRLQEAFSMVSFTQKTLPLVRKKSHKERFQKIASSLGRAQVALTEIDTYETGLIFDDEDQFQAFQSKIDDIIYWSNFHAKGKSRTPGFQKKNEPAHMLLIHLCQIWEELKGKRPTYTTNPYEDIRSGEFLGFCNSCLALAGISFSDESIIKFIQSRNKGI